MKSILILITCLFIINAQAVDHTFTYQGELVDSSVPANGTYDIAIQAFDAASFGNTVSSVSLHNGINVSNGIFTIEGVDLGAGIYNGLDIWLQISVKKSIDANYTPLSPLQKMRSVPYATTLIDKGATDGQVLTFDNVNGWQPANVSSSSDNQNIQNLGIVGTTLTVGIENGASQNVDLISLQDGTGTDNQNINSLGLAGTTLTVGIEDGISQNVDLSSLQDGTGTDSQNLSLSGTTLSITNGTNASFTGWDTSAADDFSGNYNDLSNIPSFTGWDDNASDDFSGDYNDLTNQPWTNNGPNAFRTAGYTGLGLANPAANLHIKMSSASNVSGGVRLESASSSGEDWYIRMPVSDDLVFRNDTVDVLTLKKDTGDIEIKGELQASISGDADMKAYVYGTISITGSILSSSSSSGFTVTQDGTGRYSIYFTDPMITGYVVMATVINSPSGVELYAPMFINHVPRVGNFSVYIANPSGIMSDSYFSFVVYKK